MLKGLCADSNFVSNIGLFARFSLLTRSYSPVLMLFFQKQPLRTRRDPIYSRENVRLHSEGVATQSNASIIDARQPRVNHALTLRVATQGCVNF